INGKLEICISNTGAKIDDRTIEDPANVKGQKTAAGLELIQTLLREFNLGVDNEKIRFTQEQIQDRLYKCNVIIKLNSWAQIKQN
ncbi:MAG TPA: hypothetical protein VK470_00420, partial [Bacteroidota bacterium]|nr:hypothetical protein [Bacteroidota bacterium]